MARHQKVRKQLRIEMVYWEKINAIATVEGVPFCDVLNRLLESALVHEKTPV
jgi:predicted DNA-binding ribbon-helix-helix protein